MSKQTGLAVVVAAALSAMGAASAHADTIYTYTGTDFTTVTGSYTTSDSVSGMIDLAAPLGDNALFGSVIPVSFSFSDGVQKITNLTPLYSTDILLATNGSGVPDRWDIDISLTSTFTGIIADNLCCSTFGSPLLRFTDIAISRPTTTV